MSYVMYNNNRLIPAGQLSISKQYNKRGDGVPIGKVYNIVLTGTIIAYMGSPQTDGTFWTASGFPPDETVTANSRLRAIQRKQDAILDLFSQDGLVFEVMALDGGQSFRCNPRILNVEFAPGIWYDRCEYTITMEADTISPANEDSFPQYISDASETWNVDTDETAEGLGLPRTYRFSHSVSAVGKSHYLDDGTLGRNAWEYAQSYVLSRLGFDATMALASGVLNLPSYYGGFNHMRTQNVDEAGGSFEATENWILTSGTALEEFNVDINKSLEDPFTKVSIQGTITGLEQRDSDLGLITSKYDNALTKFVYASGAALTRAQSYSGLTLNPVRLSDVVGRNPIGGTITYNYEYDTRPSTITGAKNAIISVTDNLAGQQYASIFILGRTNGPILQDLSTTQERTRSLNIELKVDPVTVDFTSVSAITNAYGYNPRLSGASAAELHNIITAVSPSSAGYSTSFKGQPQETWDPLLGSYSYQVQWTYE